MDIKLYPIKFQPILKKTVWAGNQIASFFSRPQDPSITDCGESWEVSSIPQNITVAANGPLKKIPLNLICTRYTKAFLGSHCAQTQSTDFSLLIKYLSTKKWLSIQVHPSPKIADQIPNALHKAELWVIIDAHPLSSIYLGVRPEWIAKSPLLLLQQGENITRCLQKYPVKPGDVFFIPPGQIHALGENILALEIQNSSDTTYRIYDWDRDRPIHIEKSLLSLSLEPLHASLKIPVPPSNQSILPIFSCQYFACNKLFCSPKIPFFRNLANWDHFVIWSLIQGDSLDLIYDQSACVRIHHGDTVVIPACINEIQLIPKAKNCVLIESYIPKSPFAFDL